MKRELYISVDVETSGPIPGRYSLLSVGACVVGAADKAFYEELKPISADFVPEAMKVSGFDLNQLAVTGRSPAEAMQAFDKWIEKVANGDHPVFVGFNGAFDWQFVNWYFMTYCGENPFGFGGVDIKSYYMGLEGKRWAQSSSSQLIEAYKADSPQTHNALDDARAQASMFQKMIQAAKQRTQRP
jgi:DNA polymerase III epsilon subunit-like protein